MPLAIALVRSGCPVRLLAQQDSNIHARRITNDKVGILFHDVTQDGIERRVVERLDRVLTLQRDEQDH